MNVYLHKALVRIVKDLGLPDDANTQLIADVPFPLHVQLNAVAEYGEEKARECLVRLYMEGYGPQITSRARRFLNNKDIEFLKSISKM